MRKLFLDNLSTKYKYTQHSSLCEEKIFYLLDIMMVINI